MLDFHHGLLGHVDSFRERIIQEIDVKMNTAQKATFWKICSNRKKTRLSLIVSYVSFIGGISNNPRRLGHRSDLRRYCGIGGSGLLPATSPSKIGVLNMANIKINVELKGPWLV